MTARACTFCAIAAGESAAHRVIEHDACVAFLDMRPLFVGHVLVIPRAHRETIGDLTPDELVAVFGLAQRLSRAMEVALGAEGSFVAMNNRISQSVPHAHVHVVPRRKGDGLRGFFWPRRKYKDAAEMLQTQEAIRSAMNRLRQSYQ